MSDNMWLYKLTMNNTLDNNFHSCQALIKKLFLFIVNEIIVNLKNNI